jgi:hypothetical protein
LQLVWAKLRRKKVFVWNKTFHSGNGKNYI